MAKIQFPALPALPSSARPASLAPCRCGCGTPTGRFFAPGHDAKLKGILQRVLAGVMSIEDVEAFGAAFGRAAEVRAAVVRGLSDKALLKRWKLEVPAGFVVPPAVAPPVKKVG